MNFKHIRKNFQCKTINDPVMFAHLFKYVLIIDKGGN